MDPAYKMHSTDKFMFSSFERHSSIFWKKNKNDYFMISSGTNQFSMPLLWKSAMSTEIESDFLYRWYTSEQGFQCITTAIKIYEDFFSTENLSNYVHTDRNVCMTIGGSGAASSVFEYLKKVYGECTIILVGMNYSLYERLARKHEFFIFQLTAEADLYSLPSVEDFINLPICKNKMVYVFSTPNNPTGECYTQDDFSKIVAEIKKRDGYLILDQVCNLIVSQKSVPNLEQIITRQNNWDACAVINSFSKTEAVAGLRIGYLYGTDPIIQFVKDINANTIMNPPTFPAFPIVLTCLFRCIFINKHQNNDKIPNNKIVRLFQYIFYKTSSIVPEAMTMYVDRIFKNIGEYYCQYVEELLENEKIIHINYLDTIDVLKPYVKKVSRFEGGFNMCVWFSKKFKVDEMTLIDLLLDNTGVAILTESSFSLNQVKEGEYFIRFSLACNREDYHSALVRMRHFFEFSEVFYD